MRHTNTSIQEKALQTVNLNLFLISQYHLELNNPDITEEQKNKLQNGIAKLEGLNQDILKIVQIQTHTHSISSATLLSNRYSHFQPANTSTEALTNSIDLLQKSITILQQKVQTAHVTIENLQNLLKNYNCTPQAFNEIETDIAKNLEKANHCLKLVDQLSAQLTALVGYSQNTDNHEPSSFNHN